MRASGVAARSPSFAFSSFVNSGGGTRGLASFRSSRACFIAGRVSGTDRGCAGGSSAETAKLKLRANVRILIRHIFISVLIFVKSKGIVGPNQGQDLLGTLSPSPPTPLPRVQGRGEKSSKSRLRSPLSPVLGGEGLGVRGRCRLQEC